MGYLYLIFKKSKTIINRIGLVKEIYVMKILKLEAKVDIGNIQHRNTEIYSTK